ncbi:MAG TPA: cytochrome B [Porticoccaceae bacterium]|jgi:thiosulfate reductase cytochrome b subunit|nr:cytochrome B [Porticoccaceae bacterium]
MRIGLYVQGHSEQIVSDNSKLKNSKEWIQRHSYNARICHWVTVISFGYLFWSGLMIFLQFPELYWGKVGFQGHPAVFRLSDWGLSWDQADALGDRRWGRNYHYLFAWIFAFNGIAYLGWNVWQKKFYKKMFPQREEFQLSHIKTDIQNHLQFKAPAGEKAKSYNFLQKMSYLIVLFVLFPLMFISGFAQMPAFTAILPELIDIFGGRQTARTLHVVCTLLLVLFLIVHIIEVFIAGAGNQIRSMITGKYAISTETNE